MSRQLPVNRFTTTAQGLVPAPGVAQGWTLRDDGTWGPIAGASSPLSTKGDVWGFSTVNARIPVGADGFVLTADSTQTLGLKWAAASGGSAFIRGAGWNSNSVAIVPNQTVAQDIIIPSACTLQEVYILALGPSGTVVTGSCAIFLYKAAVGSFPPLVGGDITGGVPPAIVASSSPYLNTTLSGWTTAFAQNDVVRVGLVSNSTFTSVEVSLRMQ